MPENVINTIIGGIIGIAGTYFGHKLTKAASVENIRITEFNRAAAKLRATFAPAQARIFLFNINTPEDGHILCNFIGEYIPGHAAAIEEFRPFVPISNRDAYQKAWDKYRQLAAQTPATTNGQSFERGVPIGQFFEEKIHGILSFAEN